MDVVFGALLFFAAVAALVWSVKVTRTAEPDRPIPQVRPTLRRPASATLLQVIGVGLSLASALLLQEALGAFSALAPALAATAWMLAVAAHNRQAEGQSPHAGLTR
ncbi:hypothetical protein I2487_09230 [Nesterenkonia sp. E16_10]|uniref:hypothetical protein n=2 Tax=unclassified Nesterenkonia TaxID=2629769 RepID=UPI001A91DF50|nr:hypothetical protein [Nesterenkonia sp. E16_10]MBO0595827.1 hypothetical protein [Nesterenkonia sp. E16_10]